MDDDDIEVQEDLEQQVRDMLGSDDGRAMSWDDAVRAGLDDSDDEP